MTQPSNLNHLGLDDVEHRRLTSWMAEIAVELSPGAMVRRTGREIRIGRKGSLVVSDNGCWHSFESGEGGRGPRSLIEFLRPDPDLVGLRQYALQWLRANPGMNGAVEADDDEQDAKHAALPRQVLQEMVPIDGTPGGMYLNSRGITGEWPTSLVGYVADDDREGAGAIVGVLTDANGFAAGVQLGYLDAAGHKVELGGAERRRFIIDHEASGMRFWWRPTDVDAGMPLFICEGLENLLSLAMAYPTAEVIGVPGIGAMRHLPSFAGRDLLVFRDGDDPSSVASRRGLPAGIDHLLIGGARVKITDTPLDADANSILQQGGIDAIYAVVEGAVPAELSPRGHVGQCANLSELDYQLIRKQRAKTLGIKVTALDHQVYLERARRRGGIDDLGTEDEDVHPEPVDDIAAVLDAAREEVCHYVVADPMQLDMAVMWSLHTHFVHHTTIDIAISPRLLISAPTPECGKTTLMEAIGELTAKPMELSSISAAAFYRLNDAARPTLMIDEIQGMLGRKSNGNEMEAILTASHRRRSAKTVRVEEQGKGQLVPTTFDAWGTFVATINGRMSYALESRCLQVKLRRALPGEVGRHLQDGVSDLLVDCRRKFGRWAKDQLVLPDVIIPEALSNRRGDNWRPLFKIAELVGGYWPTKIEAAAMAAMKLAVSSDVIIAFLTDVRAIIGQRDRILTTELINSLRSMEDPSWDWNTCHRGGPINAYWLRDKLADVLVPPGTREWKVGGRKRNGFTADQFNDGYQRYLQLPPVEDSTGNSGRASGSSGTETKSSHPEQKISPVPDVEDASGTSSASGTEGARNGSRSRSGPDASVTSGTEEKHRQEQEKIFPVPDGPDRKPKLRTSRIESRRASPKPPESKGIDELW
jgi:Protein of unknown function (DUF3631)/Toprim domain